MTLRLPDRTLWFFLALFAATLLLRLCHSRILWADEDYHIAAGLQTLFGKTLYRDVWYDKPPLNAWIYALIGAPYGWPLRLFGAAYVTAICAALYKFAGVIWSEREAFLAAALGALFLNFDLAAAVIPIAPDFFLMLPHIAAVYCAWRGRAFAAGVWAGVGPLFNSKALFVLAVCGLLSVPSLPWLLLGFLIPNVLALGILASGGGLQDYFRQVWAWGAIYARNSPLSDPFLNGLHRTLDWLGFHSALAIGSGWFWCRERDRTALRLALWTLISFAAVALGLRFLPRYYFQILPPVILAASRGLALLFENRAWRLRVGAVVAIALAVPLIRFGPRYAVLAHDMLVGRPTAWNDLNLDQDSQAVARIINARKHPGDTLMIWGYRPGIVVYTRLPLGSRFWDSQPLTGIPADRHIAGAASLIPEWAARNRRELASSSPTFLVDGASNVAPSVEIGQYPELRGWIAQYKIVARTALSAVYERIR